jgi:hypothetical protein
MPAPVPDLETAKRRARDMALCALPLDRQAAARVRAVNKLSVDPADLENLAAVFQSNTTPFNLLGGYRFQSTPAFDQELVKTIPWMESRLGERAREAEAMCDHVWIFRGKDAEHAASPATMRDVRCQVQDGTSKAACNGRARHAGAMRQPMRTGRPRVSSIWCIRIRDCRRTDP